MQNTQGIELEYSEITFKRDNHKNRFSMGIGSFGEVYVASFRGQEVAIKELKREAIKNGVNEFLNESIILRRMKHPNIINLYGICTDRAINCKNLSERENFYCLVMEYGSKGSLHNLIHESNEIFDEKKIISILLQIGHGLFYLHSSSPPIIHGDLKPTNIIFDNENIVKLMDFGFSTIKKETREYNNETTSKGQLRWMAPELLTEKPTLKSDIYSFGIIAWQLLTRKLPYSDAKNEVQVFNSMKDPNTIKFQFPLNTSLALKQLGERCLNRNPELRPSAKDITECLNSFPNVNNDSIIEKPITNFSSYQVVSIITPLFIPVSKSIDPQKEVSKFSDLRNKFEHIANNASIKKPQSLHKRLRSIGRTGKLF